MIPAAVYAADNTEGSDKNFTYVDVVFRRRRLRTILGVSWRDRITNDELMKRAGIEDLLNIVRVRRMILAGHILRLLSDRPANVAMQWISDGGKRKEDIQGRPGDVHSGKIYSRCESAGVVLAEWQVI